MTSSGATYTYDAVDQRIAKTGGSNPTETIYFGVQPIAFHNPSSGAWTDVIYAGSSMIAEVAGTQTALPTYRHVDHLGSLAIQTNNSGAVTGSNVFLPFGDLLSSTTSDVFQYTGLPQDTENSSAHAMFRNLSTTQSRWLRPDPYNGSYDITNPQSFNRYAYAMNNPLAYVDPSGLDHTDENGQLVGDGPGETMTEGDGTVITWDPTTNMWVGPGNSPAPVPNPNPPDIGDIIGYYPSTLGVYTGSGTSGGGTATSIGPELYPCSGMRRQRPVEGGNRNSPRCRRNDSFRRERGERQSIVYGRCFCKLEYIRKQRCSRGRVFGS